MRNKKLHPYTVYEKLILFLGFITLIELPLSFSMGDYSFQYPLIDLMLSGIYGFFLYKHEVKNHHKKHMLFVSILPVEYLSFILDVKTMGIVRILRILRLILPFEISKSHDFRSKESQTFALVMGIIMLVHMITCGWLIVQGVAAETFLDQYILASYWAVTTLTTVGYGDITPLNHLARFYTMGTMLTGVGIFGIVIGKFSSLIMNADKYQEEKRSRIHNLMNFLERYEVPATTSLHVMRYYQYQVEKNIAEKDGQILNDLPESFQHELKIYMKVKFIKNLPLFRDLSTDCLNQISLKLEERFYLPRQHIVKSGELGNEMFIVSHGEVNVTRDNKVLSSLRPGQFFGEIALIDDTVRSADVFSATYSDILILKKEDFFKVCENFPELKERFYQFHQSRRIERKAA